jgi:hypothetical protein
MSNETLQLDLTAGGKYFTGQGSTGLWTKLTWSIPTNLRGDYNIYLKYVAVDLGTAVEGTATKWITFNSPQMNLKYGGGSVELKPCFFVSTNGINMVSEPTKYDSQFNSTFDVEVNCGYAGELVPASYNKAVLQFSVYKNATTDRNMTSSFLKMENQ